LEETEENDKYVNFIFFFASIYSRWKYVSKKNGVSWLKKKQFWFNKQKKFTKNLKWIK